MKKATLPPALVLGGVLGILGLGCESNNMARSDAAAVEVPDGAADTSTTDGGHGGSSGGSAGSAGSAGSGGGLPTATGGRGGDGVSSGGSGPGGTTATGGASTSTGGATAPSTGGVPATGGRGSGGVIGSGGSATGGSATGGAVAATGGRAATGGVAATGGRAATGGMGTGGASTGGASTGGAVGTGGMGTGGASTGGATGTQAASLYVVAHPDDELLFANPDLETEIQSGRPVVTVYLTSGDGGNPNSAWRARETSGMAAHAAMAGVTSDWLCGGATYAGKLTTRCTLSGRPGLAMVMLRVIDGTVPNSTFTGTVSTIDASATYTRAELIATLAAIQAQVAPGRVGTMDGTLAHGSDHQDHVATAVLMFDVARGDGVARALTMYRAYNMFEPSFATGPQPAAEPANLTTAQYQEKLRIISVYEAPPLDDGFDEWCKRMYPVRMITGVSAPLHTSAGGCLQASGNADGAAVTVATCNGAATQNWILGTNSRVTGTGGRCLGVATGGTAAVLRTCNNAAADQRWTLLSNGQLRGTALTCLTFSGSSVSATTCGSDTSQARYSPPAAQRWTR